MWEVGDGEVADPDFEIASHRTAKDGPGGASVGASRPAGGDLDQRSTQRAMPMPPPMHRVARPFLASRFCIS